MGNALTSANFKVAYVALAPGNEVVLKALANDACSAVGINNNGAASQIVGSCKNANGVGQAVIWKANTATTAVTLLQPLPGLLGLGADVVSSVSGQNIQGSVVGESVSNDGTGTPVIWLAGSATPTQLTVGLLNLTSTNCVPADISDPISANGNQAAIVGECPNDGTNVGKPMPVLWANPSAPAQLLPLAPGAQFCGASEINVNGYVLGECIYPNSTYRTVRWALPWSAAPAVLQSLPGGATLRNSGTDMNVSGQIVGSYIAAGGFSLPFSWDPLPAGTNTVGVSIVALPGGNNASVSAIGNNGEIVGTGETTGGNAHEFHLMIGSTTPIDDGTLPGGSNSGAAGISPNGTIEVGGSEVAGHVSHSTVETLP